MGYIDFLKSLFVNSDTVVDSVRNDPKGFFKNVGFSFLFFFLLNFLISGATIFFTGIKTNFKGYTFDGVIKLLNFGGLFRNTIYLALFLFIFGLCLWGWGAWKGTIYTFKDFIAVGFLGIFFITVSKLGGLLSFIYEKTIVYGADLAVREATKKSSEAVFKTANLFYSFISSVDSLIIIFFTLVSITFFWISISFLLAKGYSRSMVKSIFIVVFIIVLLKFLFVSLEITQILPSDLANSLIQGASLFTSELLPFYSSSVVSSAVSSLANTYFDLLDSFDGFYDF